MVINPHSAFTYHCDKHLTWICSLNSHDSLTKEPYHCAHRPSLDPAAQRGSLSKITQPVSRREDVKARSPWGPVSCSPPPGGFSYRRRSWRAAPNSWSVVKLGCSRPIHHLHFLDHLLQLSQHELNPKPDERRVRRPSSRPEHRTQNGETRWGKWLGPRGCLASPASSFISSFPWFNCRLLLLKG